MPTYTIKGVTYLPLAALCNSRDITWEYDTFTRSAVLKKEGHKINLRVGDDLVLVDGVAENISSPVDIYQGVLVVPYRFKVKILDDLYKTPTAGRRLPVVLSRLKTIVIDAGHGGKDPGTTGKTGLKEKDINLDIARRLARILKNSGVNVIMTRTNDTYPSLARRVAIANNAKADLFMSIHTNANRVRSLKGFEVYYVSPKADDSKRALASAREAALNLDKSCFAGNSLYLRATVWDLLYTYNRGESMELASSICHTIHKNVDVCVLGVKNANFFVLRGARMPAVLVEIGFLSNSKEERLLKNNFYRQEIAESLTRGLEDYEQGLPIVTSRY
ncbi:MAG: N-acetylmuramoyl-L-alanine amidase [Candidatus Omnitrophica bacterium]|nr:N-acetylmuramoyl-L-alanine amidase [Candidatus Omnitrophota bacterium]